MPATGSTPDVPIPRRGRLSFSIGGLLLTTTCLAVALAITNWSLWDNDERWLLRVWFAAAITLGLLDRLRGQRGILAAALGGGLAPAILTLQIWQNPSRFAIGPQPWIGELGHNAVLLAFFAGALAAGLLALLCWFGPRMPSRTSVVLISLVALSVAAWWGFEAVRWHPRLSIDRATTRDKATTRPNVALSSDGRLLAVALHPSLVADGRNLELWSIADKSATRLAATRIEHPVRHLEFSPDGRKLVALPAALFPPDNDPIPAVLWFDVAAALRDPPAQSNYPWSLDDIRFSGDGKLLTGVGQGVDGLRRQITIDAATLEVKSSAILDRRSMAAVHPLGTTVVQRESILNWDSIDEELSVRRAPTSNDQLIIAPDDRWIATPDFVVEVQTQRARRLEARALGSAGGGKWIVASRSDQSKHSWMARFPYFRHCYWREGERSQLVLIDPATGRVVRTSSWHRMLGSLAVSHDGSVLATSISSGQILIWDVPR